MELLDGPLDDRAALVSNLRDLARLNRLSGGTRLSVAAIRELAGGDLSPSILDVGTGGADIPVALLAAARRDGRDVRVTAVDSRAEVLEGVESIEGEPVLHNNRAPRCPVVASDARLATTWGPCTGLDPAVDPQARE